MAAANRAPGHGDGAVDLPVLPVAEGDLAGGRLECRQAVVDDLPGVGIEAQDEVAQEAEEGPCVGLRSPQVRPGGVGTVEGVEAEAGAASMRDTVAFPPVSASSLSKNWT